ncbi:hypothetical protein AYO41_00590 [Verrucomicrobia bacterium SCGC AG-212-E04]|nr:hypothetical protein AYO41_00590 [Verrucomicrobia bacterium SCGC AG-212-E04]
MKKFEGFEIEDGRGLFRPAGNVAFDEVVILVRAAITAARENMVQDLLVDMTGLTGFRSPRILDRFLAAVAWSDEAKGGVRLAMVAKKEMIYPRKFGVTVAAKRGLVSNIFPTEKLARAWLDAPCPDEP